MIAQRCWDNDKQLIEDCRHGDAGAWREFHARFAPRLAGILACLLGRYARDRHVVDNLLQEVEIAFWCQLERGLWRGPAAVHIMAYLTVACRHAVLDWLRREHRRPGRTLPDVPDRAALGEPEVEQQDFIAVFLRTLPPSLAALLRERLGDQTVDLHGLTPACRRQLDHRLRSKWCEFCRRHSEQDDATSGPSPMD